MKMPRAVFVRIEKEFNGNEYLCAYDSMNDAIEDDGPTTIGVFKYVGTVKRKKVVALA